MSKLAIIFPREGPKSRNKVMVDISINTTPVISAKTSFLLQTMGDKSVEFLSILVITMLIFLFLRLHRPQRLHNIELGGRGYQRIEAGSK